MHSKEFGSKHFPTGSHASQHRISVPRCLFLFARNAVEAVSSVAPTLSGVLRESSRTVCLLASSRTIYVEVCECTKWVGRALVIVIELFQNGTENGMFGHPTRIRSGVLE